MCLRFQFCCICCCRAAFVGMCSCLLAFASAPSPFCHNPTAPLASISYRGGQESFSASIHSPCRSPNRKLHGAAQKVVHKTTKGRRKRHWKETRREKTKGKKKKNTMKKEVESEKQGWNTKTKRKANQKKIIMGKRREEADLTKQSCQNGTDQISHLTSLLPPTRCGVHCSGDLGLLQGLLHRLLTVPLAWSGALTGLVMSGRQPVQSARSSLLESLCTCRSLGIFFTIGFLWRKLQHSWSGLATSLPLQRANWALWSHSKKSETGSLGALRHAKNEEEPRTECKDWTRGMKQRKSSFRLVS